MEKTAGFILDPTTGDPLQVPVVKFDAEDAALLRRYKKQILSKYGLVEALYCSDCFENNLSHGCEAFVTSDKVMIRCRCKMRIFDGPTY